MFRKNNDYTKSLVIIFCILHCTTATFCSLDRMKKFAMEACEHLFGFETLEVRERRSIEFDSAASRHFVRRSNYPLGGYLKVGIDHYRKLSQVDISPRYKAKKFNSMHHEKPMRFKRGGGSDRYKNNISYCCYHKCGEDFFC